MSGVHTILSPQSTRFVKDRTVVRLTCNSVTVETDNGDLLVMLDDLPTLALLLEYARDTILNRQVAAAKGENK